MTPGSAAMACRTALRPFPARPAAGGGAEGAPEPEAAPASQQGVAELAEAGRQVLADRGDMSQQPVALDHLEYGQGRGAGDRVAAEGGAMVALGEAGTGLAQADARAN